MNGNGHGVKSRVRRDYFWVCAIEKISGRPIIDGPHDTDMEANQWGFEHIRDGDFKVYSFRTINKQAARDMLKHIMLEQSKDLSVVFKRARYKI